MASEHGRSSAGAPPGRARSVASVGAAPSRRALSVVSTGGALAMPAYEKRRRPRKEWRGVLEGKPRDEVEMTARERREAYDKQVRACPGPPQAPPGGPWRPS